MRYYLYTTSTHDSYGATLHIARDRIYPEAANIVPQCVAEVDWEHPEQIKAVTFFARNVMGLHVCHCDEA